MSTVTFTLPAVTLPPQSISTPKGSLVLPGQELPARTVTVDPELIASLIDAARQAARNAYAPYSKFHVGAALVMADDPNKEIITGANVENSSYGVSMCGERTALFHAAAKGYRRLKYLAVSTVDSLEGPLRERSPCGVCRQAMREFIPVDTKAADALIFVDTGNDGDLAEVFDIDRLLPYGFNFSGPDA